MAGLRLLNQSYRQRYCVDHCSIYFYLYVLGVIERFIGLQSIHGNSFAAKLVEEINAPVTNKFDACKRQGS
jgi:hypothetical protein